YAVLTWTRLARAQRPGSIGRRRWLAARGLRRPLVLGDLGAGVDCGRDGMRARRLYLRLADHARPPVTIGGRAARVGRLPFFFADRLGSDHEFHRRPQVCPTDLGDVIAF